MLDHHQACSWCLHGSYGSLCLTPPANCESEFLQGLFYRHFFNKWGNMWKEMRMSFAQILLKSNPSLVCPLSHVPGLPFPLSKCLLGIGDVLLLVQDSQQEVIFVLQKCSYLYTMVTVKEMSIFFVLRTLRLIIRNFSRQASIFSWFVALLTRTFVIKTTK